MKKKSTKDKGYGEGAFGAWTSGRRLQEIKRRRHFQSDKETLGYLSECKWTAGSAAAGSHHGSQKNWVSLGGEQGQSWQSCWCVSEGFWRAAGGFQKEPEAQT